MSEIAVLYRSNAQAKVLEEELRVAGIPYRVFGGTRFYDRKEIKDGIAYLRVVLNPRDDLSLRRIVNTPPRGLGQQSLRHIADYGAAHRVPLLRAFERASEIAPLSPTARRSAGELARAIVLAREGFQHGAFGGAASTLLKTVGLLQDEADAQPESERRQANIRYLLRSIERLEARSGADREALQYLLHQIALDPNDEETPEAAEQVTLSSLHSAKGLEFSIVFLFACVEGVLPHTRTTDPRITDATVGDLDEERRLFYVGVTRARDLLYLTRHEERVRRGRVVKMTPSRFLQDLREPDVEAYRSPDSRALERQEVADMAEALLRRLGAGGS